MTTKSESALPGRQGQKNVWAEEKNPEKYLAMIDTALEEMGSLRRRIKDSQVRTSQTATETRAILAQLDQLLPSGTGF